MTGRLAAVTCDRCGKPRVPGGVAVMSEDVDSYCWGALDHLRRLVAEQADDEGLWFIAETAPEAYLQGALRRLHAAIESEE